MFLTTLASLSLLASASFETPGEFIEQGCPQAAVTPGEVPCTGVYVEIRHGDQRVSGRIVEVGSRHIEIRNETTGTRYGVSLDSVLLVAFYTEDGQRFIREIPAD